jgi:hypothetical protein
MKVKFLRTIIANFGTFEADSIHDLIPDQYEVFKTLNEGDFEVVEDEA